MLKMEINFGKIQIYQFSRPLNSEHLVQTTE